MASSFLAEYVIILDFILQVTDCYRTLSVLCIFEQADEYTCKCFRIVVSAVCHFFIVWNMVVSGNIAKTIGSTIR